MYLKVVHQAISPFVGAPCPAVVAGGVATEDLPLSSKVLTSPEVRNLSLPPATNLPVLQDLPQVHPLVRSLFLEDLQCWYPLAGRLKYFRKNRENLSSDQAVRNMISGYKVPFSEVPCQGKHPKQVPVPREKYLLVDIEIQTLLEKGPIKMTDSSHDKYLSSIFLVEKKDSSQRPVINLKSLNQHIPYGHFKMKVLYLLKELLKEGDFLYKQECQRSSLIFLMQGRLERCILRCSVTQRITGFCMFLVERQTL